MEEERKPERLEKTPNDVLQKMPLKPENSSPNRDLNRHTGAGGGRFAREPNVLFVGWLLA